MTSQINPNMPVQGNPTTASVRANFATAQAEISALQDNTSGAPFLPLAGGTMQGPLTLKNDPTTAMQPVTLGYFQANGGGGGSGPAGVPEAPADGTPYGRQDASWVHVVNTAQLNSAIAAAPFLPIAGGTLQGMLTLSGPPTAALHPASKGYVDAGFLPFGGGTLTGPLTLSANAASALQPVTLQQLQASNFVAQLGPSSIGVTVADNTTGSDRTPVIAGLITPYNGTSDGLKVQAKRLAAPGGSNNAYGDGPHIQLYGPSAGANANQLTLNAGNNTAGYNTWVFGPDGSLSSPGFGRGGAYFYNGRVVSLGGSGQNPSLACYDTSQGWGGGMFVGASQVLAFSAMNSTGGFQPSLWAFFNANGVFNVGNARAVNDPLLVAVASGYSARTLYQASRLWSCGHNPDGSFSIADETSASQRFALGPAGGPCYVYTGRFVVQGAGGSNPSVTVYDIAGGASGMFCGGSTALYFSQMNATGGFANIRCLLDSSPNMTMYGGAFKPGGGVWADSSDARIKDVRDDYRKGLIELAQLKPKRFTYRGNDVVGDDGPRFDSPHRSAARDGTVFAGLVAQEVEDIFPECVGRRKGWIDGKAVDDIRTLDITPMLYAVINAMGEIADRLAALETSATRH